MNFTLATPVNAGPSRVMLSINPQKKWQDAIAYNSSSRYRQGRERVLLQVTKIINSSLITNQAIDWILYV